MTKIVKGNNIPYTETNAIFHEGKRLDKVVGDVNKRVEKLGDWQKNFKIEGETIKYVEGHDVLFFKKSTTKIGDKFIYNVSPVSSYDKLDFSGVEITSAAKVDYEFYATPEKERIEPECFKVVDGRLDFFVDGVKSYTLIIPWQWDKDYNKDYTSLDPIVYPYPYIESNIDLGNSVWIYVLQNVYNQFPRSILSGFLSDMSYVKKVLSQKKDIEDRLTNEILNFASVLPKNHLARPLTIELLEDSEVTLSPIGDFCIYSDRNLYNSQNTENKVITAEKGQTFMLFGEAKRSDNSCISVSGKCIVYGNPVSLRDGVSMDVIHYRDSEPLLNFCTTQGYILCIYDNTISIDNVCDARELVVPKKFQGSASGRLKLLRQCTLLEYLPRDSRTFHISSILPELKSSPYIYRDVDMAIFNEENVNIKTIYLLTNSVFTAFFSDIASRKCGGSEGYFIVSEDFEMPDLSNTRFANWKVIRVKPYNEGDDLTYYDFENLKKEYTMQCVLEALKYATFTQDVSGILSDL